MPSAEPHVHQKPSARGLFQCGNQVPSLSCSQPNSPPPQNTLRTKSLPQGLRQRPCFPTSAPSLPDLQLSPSPPLQICPIAGPLHLLSHSLTLSPNLSDLPMTDSMLPPQRDP
jgi:hypothetical protein